MKTSIYVCADGTMTYGPYGGQEKIIEQALPVGIANDEAQAKRIITLFGRRAYDVPSTDARFEQQLKGRKIKPGYGPTYRYYYSGPEFERNNWETLFAVRRRIESAIDNAI